MKAIIKIGKVEVKFEVPDPETRATPPVSVQQNEEHKFRFMRESKRLALSLYKDTKKKGNKL